MTGSTYATFHGFGPRQRRNVAGFIVPAASSVWYGCMTTQPSAAQYPSSVRIISWKFTALSLTACPRRQQRGGSRLRAQRAEAEAAVVLVGRRDDAEGLAGSAFRQSRVAGLSERSLEQTFDSEQPLARQRQRSVGAGLADRTARARGVAGEARLGTALGAARHVRQVAGEPEQLQLEGEDERIETGRPPCRAHRVEEVEKPRERLKGPLVCLLLGEEAQHRLGAHEADAEPVRLLTGLPVGANELRAGHRLELAAALVKHELDVAQGLEAPAEPGLRLPDPLRDRADATALAGVEMEDAIGLAEAKRAQHHRFGLVRAAAHEASVETGQAGNRRRVFLV